MTPPVLWTPPDSLLQRCELGAYRRERGFDTYDELWRWSVEDPEAFWASIWDRYGHGERGDTVLASSAMPGAPCGLSMLTHRLVARTKEDVRRPRSLLCGQRRLACSGSSPPSSW